MKAKYYLLVLCFLAVASGLSVAQENHRDMTDGLKYISSGNYEGEHWLASFAVFMLSTFASE